MLESGQIYMVAKWNIMKQYFYVNVKNKMVNRMDYLISCITWILHLFFVFIFYFSIFKLTNRLGGLTLEQCGFLIFNSLFFIGLEGSFLNGVIDISSMIYDGTLDNYLVKPLAPLFHITVSRFQLQLSEIIVGLCGMIYFLPHSTLNLQFYHIMILVLMGLLYLVIIYCLELILSCTAFWFKKVDDLKGIIYQFIIYGEYPTTIFPSAFQFIVVFLIPFAFRNFIPFAVIIGLISLPIGLGLEIFVALMFIFLSTILWKMGLKRYESVGIY